MVESSTKTRALTCMGLNMTPKQWLILSALCSVSITSGTCVSLQGPIYPQEAERKGATATEYGLVFGVFELVAFITCPIYGKYMDRFGARNLLLFGVTVCGLSSILFGLLDLIEGHLPFISMSFVFRILESLGSSAAFTSSFTFAAIVFSENVGTIYAIMECFFGLGFALGPSIGGYLYELGGFITPFAVIGIVLLIDGVCLFFAIPSITRDVDQSKPKVGILSVLRLVPALLDYFSIIVSNICIGFNMAILEPHLRQFEYSNSITGTIFATLAAFYMLSSPVVGRLCDTHINPKYLIILGTILAFIGNSLIGPLPFLDIESSMWFVVPGLAITGVGVSCLMVPGFIDAIKSAVQGGLPDDISTYSVVSGLSTSSVYLGAFIGPSIAGVLYDAYGYRWSTLFVVAMVLFQMICMVTYVTVKRCSSHPAEAENPVKDSDCARNHQSHCDETFKNTFTTVAENK